MSGADRTTTERRRLAGWGGTAPAVAEVAPVRSVDEVAATLAAADAAAGAGAAGAAGAGRGVVARGLGRSYGDAAQRSGGLVLDLTGLDGVLSVDVEGAEVRVEAGVDLDRLTRLLLPLGLWLPVVPGTRQVTVGGAVAADVHGKNHHVDGSFGDHVRSLDLVTPDGAVRTLRPDGGPDRDPEEARLFWATVGGMGLTGVVVRATLSCVRAETSYAVVDTERCRDLDHLLDRLSDERADLPYSVAWFDAMARGRRLGRAVLTRGRLATRADLPARLADRPVRLPPERRGPVVPTLPRSLVTPSTARAFSEAWFRKAPARPTTDVQDLGAFFQPLDGLQSWNRLYGPGGFCQYQFVVPPGEVDAFRAAVRLIAESGHPSCLNVLKRMGPEGRGLISFPAPGWTLAVDVPVTPGVDRLFAALDELVLSAGGRVYLAKDARMPARHLPRMYPRLEQFLAVRRAVDPHGVLASDLSRRLRLDRPAAGRTSDRPPHARPNTAATAAGAPAGRPTQETP